MLWSPVFTLKTIKSQHVKYDAMLTILLPQSSFIACGHRVIPEQSIAKLILGFELISAETLISSPSIFFVLVIVAYAGLSSILRLYSLKLYSVCKMKVKCQSKITPNWKLWPKADSSHTPSLDPPTSSLFTHKAPSKQAFDQYSGRQVRYVSMASESEWGQIIFYLNCLYIDFWLWQRLMEQHLSCVALSGGSTVSYSNCMSSLSWINAAQSSWIPQHSCSPIDLCK